MDHTATMIALTESAQLAGAMAYERMLLVGALIVGALALVVIRAWWRLCR